MLIRISQNVPEIGRKLAGLSDDIQKRVLASSLNKMVAQAKTKMAREMTTEYNVTSSYAKSRLTVEKAVFQRDKFEAALVGGDGRRRSANVFRFMEKSVSLAQGRKRKKAGTQNQLRFKIKRSNGLVLIRDAFLANKGRTIFIRVRNKQMASRSGRLTKHSEAIRAVSTIDIPSMFNQRRINAAVVDEINTKLPVIIDRDIAYFVNRFNGS